MDRLQLREDGSEILQYNAPDFPLRTAYGHLSAFADYAAGCHWHHDFEALIAVDHEMDYQVNESSVHLLPGDAIFVNSNRLHYGYSALKEDCTYCFAVFPAELLGVLPAIASTLEHLSEDTCPDYWTFSARNNADAGFLTNLRFLCDHGAPEESLAILSAAASMMNELSVRTQDQVMRPLDPDWAIVRTMVGYIQSSYQEKITIEDIASAGAVCRSKCCQLFRERLHTTPLNYLNRYRLEKACDLIRAGMSITDAAFESGFHGSSYFSETFRKVFGLRPSEYARQFQEAGSSA